MEGYGNENPGAFQSTRPLRGATATTTSSVVHALFQPMRPLRGATPAGQLPFMRQPYFNPRAPCGARPFLPTRQCLPKEFQPTRPLRGATAKLLTTLLPLVFQPTRPLRGATTFLPDSLILIDISTHAPLAGRDTETVHKSGYTSISTHAPLAGRDVSWGWFSPYYLEFQPTRPLRGATYSCCSWRI